MNLTITCNECAYTVEGRPERALMNNVIMWNHSKKAHPLTAERLMRAYRTLPYDLYRMSPATAAALQ